MPDLLIAAAMLALAAGLGVLGATARARRRRAWYALAEQLGLTHVSRPQTLDKHCVLQGIHKGALLRLIEEGGSSNDPPTTTLALDGRGRLAHVAELRAEADVSDAERAAFRELELGDLAFDDKVFLRGARPALVALLDPGTRQLIARFAAKGGEVDDGVVLNTRRGFLDPRARDDVDWLRGRLASSAEVVARLTDPEDLVACLCQRFRDEPEPRVRLLILDVLVNLLADDERPRQVLREALTCDDLLLRLRAAIALGEEGRDTLLEIAGRREGDDQCPARAVQALHRRLPLDRALAILDAALQDGRRAVAAAVIAALGEIGGDAAIGRLSLELSSHGARIGLAAAAALGATGDPSAEAPLLATLARAQPILRVALVDALAKVGTASAVPRLRATAEEDPADRLLARAARQAIAQIQGRLMTASPGQISLADGQAGQVSLTDDTAGGRVTLATEDRDAP